MCLSFSGIFEFDLNDFSVKIYHLFNKLIALQPRVGGCEPV